MIFGCHIHYLISEIPECLQLSFALAWAISDSNRSDILIAKQVTTPSSPMGQIQYPIHTYAKM